MSQLLDVKAELESMVKVLAGTTQGEAVKFALTLLQERDDLRNAIRTFIADFDCIAWRNPGGNCGLTTLVSKLEDALYPPSAR